jgi:hypothetical protein
MPGAYSVLITGHAYVFVQCLQPCALSFYSLLGTSLDARKNVTPAWPPKEVIASILMRSNKINSFRLVYDINWECLCTGVLWL